MSAIANIAIADGAATPVTHTFVPLQTSPDAVWMDSDSAKAFTAAQYSIRNSIKRGNSSKGVDRVKFAVTLPTMGTGVSLPASEVDYTDTCIIEFILPKRGIKQGRKDLRTLVKNLLGDAQVVDIIDELRSAY